MPYPLFGEQLTNRVSYVNIDRHVGWRFDDYARARSGPGATLPSPPLALSSGELMPVRALPGSGVNAYRPRVERIEDYREALIQNLKSAGVDHLFITMLSAYEIDHVWHNEGGFPTEDESAKAYRGRTSSGYENPQVRIHAVVQP